MRVTVPRLLCALFLTLLPAAVWAQASCSPAAYTAITNTAPLPADFCAYRWAPYRNRLPEQPQRIDQGNSTILQREYAPNSVPGTVNAGIGQLMTIGVLPTAPPQGNSGYPVYIASASDPLVSINCARVAHGCSDSDGNRVASIPAFHIPPYARGSTPISRWSNLLGDNNMEIIQPDGTTRLLYNCMPLRDWHDDDVLKNNTCDGYGSGSPIAGAATGSIVTSAGVNPGNLNGGDNFAALPVHYQEVMQGQINHALVV